MRSGDGNGWPQLAVLDSHSTEMHVFENDEFRPYQPQTTRLPVDGSSIEWYRGRRNLLRFAGINPNKGKRS